MARHAERRPGAEDDVDRIRALLEPEFGPDGPDRVATDDAFDRVRQRIGHQDTIELGPRPAPTSGSRQGGQRQSRRVVAVTSVAVAVTGVIALSIATGADLPPGTPTDEPPVADTDRPSPNDDEISVALTQMTDRSANETLHDAYEHLRVMCMRDAGFQHWAEPQTDGAHPWRGVIVRPDHHLFELTEQQAAQAGVTVPSGDLDLGSADGRGDLSSPNADYIASLNPDQADRYHAAWSGTPEAGNHVVVEHPDGAATGVATNGCTAQARATLFGDLATYLELAYIASNLEHLALVHLIDTDQHVSTWRSCMHDEGYPGLTSPEQTIEAAATGDEQRVADTHAACLNQSGLRAAFPELLDSALDDTTARYEDELIAFTHIQRDALETADEILTRTPDR